MVNFNAQEPSSVLLPFLDQLWLLLAGVINFLQRGKNRLSTLTIGCINHRVSHACFAGTSPLRDANLRVGFSL